MADSLTIKKYFKIWLLTTTRVSQIAFVSRFGAIIFAIGKILRFGFFLFFLIILGTKTQAIASYSLWQIIFFFATFNLVDTTTQLFFREVYRFRSYVVSGEFDYVLTKPVSPLFRSLLGGSDVLDLPMLALSIIFLAVAAAKIGSFLSVLVLIYFLLVLNALLIALSLHIIVLAICLLTTEIDHTIMIYRDITQMGRLPTDIYRFPINFIVTFILPVGIMMTIPAKALMGLINWQLILSSFSIAIIIFLISLKFWNLALKNYSSVSS